MVKIYSDGFTFYKENEDFLVQDPYVEVFFKLDSNILLETNDEEFALKISEENKTLLVMSKNPYPMLFMGDNSLIEELVDFLIKNNYKIHDYMCRTDIGDALLNSYQNNNYKFYCSIRMDFMECKTKNTESNELIEIPTEKDIDEIYQMNIDFVKDCGLNDQVFRENIAKAINNYRIIRIDGEIASMATTAVSTKNDRKIAAVYTRPKFRGKGFAKKIVGTIVNETIDAGLYATLNVDQNNPISYHVYTKLGFKKIFTQAIYYLK